MALYFSMDQTTTGVEVSIKFFPLAFLLFFCTPTVVIDGQPQRKPWGRHFIPTTPGSHHVRIFFRYLWWAECGANEITVDVADGQKTRVDFYMPPWMLAAGSIKEVKQLLP